MTVNWNKPNYAETNGIRMAYYEAGKGVPVVMCHGFPELAYAWRHQIPALVAAGYRVIAPDRRGCGDSSSSRCVPWAGGPCGG